MIGFLSGVIRDCNENILTVEVSGVGYMVQVPQPSLFPLGQPATLLVHMHWNSENGPSLFGFANNLERSVFLMITSCSGLGPKLAMAVLAQLGASEFLEAVQAANEDALSNVSGIGAKKAEQIIVQLKHKVAKLVESGVALGSSETLEKRHEISQVLKSLNYSPQEIRSAMAYVNDKYPQNSVAFDALLRHALAFLSKRA